MDIALCEECFAEALCDPQHSPELQAAIRAFWTRLPELEDPPARTKRGDVVTVLPSSGRVHVPSVGTVISVSGTRVMVALMTGRRIDVSESEIDYVEAD